jgi:zinc resistance-associated protein
MAGLTFILHTLRIRSLSMTKRAPFLVVLTAASALALMVAAQAQQPSIPTGQSSSSFNTQGSGFTAEDRAAFFEARLAAIRAGLRLTAAQEAMWPPVEAAARDMAKQATELRAQRESIGGASDPIERMARMGDAASKRGAAMTKLAEAARPLYASLNEDQKRRLQVLLHAGGPSRHGYEERSQGRGYMLRGDHEHMSQHRQRGESDGYRSHERGGYRGEHRHWNDWP